LASLEFFRTCGKALSITGSLLIGISFITPWIKVTYLGSLTMVDLLWKQGTWPNAEKFLALDLTKNVPIAVTGGVLSLLSLAAGLSVTYSKRAKILTALTALSSVMAILGSLLWILSTNGTKITLQGVTLLMSVEYGPYVAVIGGALMAASSYFFHSASAYDSQRERNVKV